MGVKSRHLRKEFRYTSVTGYGVGRLDDFGISPATATRWVRQGRLHRVGKAVYSYLPADSLTPEARRLAALLEAGPGGVLSHVTAACFWKIWRGRETTVELVSPAHQRSGRLFTMSHSRTIRPGDIALIDPFRVTVPARTIVDLCDRLTPWQVANVMHEAGFRELLDLAGVREQVQRTRHRHGAPIARKALELHLSGSYGTRSFLEDAMLGQVLSANLPEPLVNTPRVVAGMPVEVDMLWIDEHLAIEVDGGQHQRPYDLARDEQRDAHLRAHGFRVLRFAADAVRAGHALRQVRAALSPPC